jgi:secreted trypsin-like serine protease
LNAPGDGGNAGGIALNRWYGLRYVSEATAQLNTMMQDQSMLVGSSNPALDYNGTCNGDSGGPNFYIDSEGRKIQIGVSSSGDKRCRAASIISRLDISQAQEFIACAVDASTEAEYAACGCTTLNIVGVCD